MILSLMVFDDFLDVAEWFEWRKLAQQADYQERKHTDGYTYANIGEVPAGLSLAGHITHALNRPIFEHLQYFRRGEPQDGAGNIHVDHGEGKWATVLYLNSPEELGDAPTGTAFWAHRWMGQRGLPTGTVEEELLTMLNDDREDVGKWELDHMVPARPNRLIIYPTSLFHSRWPLDPSPGRLVHTSFFS